MVVIDTKGNIKVATSIQENEILWIANAKASILNGWCFASVVGYHNQFLPVVFRIMYGLALDRGKHLILKFMHVQQTLIIMTHWVKVYSQKRASNCNKCV